MILPLLLASCGISTVNGGVPICRCEFIRLLAGWGCSSSRDDASLCCQTQYSMNTKAILVARHRRKWLSLHALFYDYLSTFPINTNTGDFLPKNSLNSAHFSYDEIWCFWTNNTLWKCDGKADLISVKNLLIGSLWILMGMMMQLNGNWIITVYNWVVYRGTYRIKPKNICCHGWYFREMQQFIMRNSSTCILCIKTTW